MDQETLDALPEVRTDSESEDDYGLLVDLEEDEEAPARPADTVAKNWFAQDAVMVRSLPTFAIERSTWLRE